MTTVALLVNPTAGRRRGGSIAAAAVVRLRQRGLQPDLRITAAPGDVERLARSLAAAGADRLLVCGGDGTMHEAANALGGSGTVLGILPAGRGNDLAAALSLPLAPAAAIDCFLDGSVRQVDLGAVNGRRFATVLAMGLDADVALRTRSGFWSHAGRPGYVACAVARLFSYRAPRLAMAGDFGRREGAYLLCAASNTGSYGGGVRIAPDSSVDDGLFDLCLVRDLPRYRALQLIPRILAGRHVGSEDVELLRTTWLEVDSEGPVPLVADGEPVGTTPVRISLEPGALRVMTPT